MDVLREYLGKTKDQSQSDADKRAMDFYTIVWLRLLKDVAFRVGRRHLLFGSGG